MKITQQTTREGDDIVLRLHEQPSGNLLGTRVWKDAAKYLDPEASAKTDMLVLVIPEKVGINIVSKES